MFHTVHQHLAIVVGKHCVTFFGEEHFEFTSVCDVAIMRAENVPFAPNYMRLGIGLIHITESSPAHLPTKDFPGLLLDSQGFYQSRGRTHIF